MPGSGVILFIVDSDVDMVSANVFFFPSQRVKLIGNNLPHRKDKHVSDEECVRIGSADDNGQSRDYDWTGVTHGQGNLTTGQ